MHKFKWWNRKKEGGMSELNPKLPRYHKGYDIDELFRKKWKENTQLTEDELDAMEDVIHDYYAQNFKKENQLIVYGIRIYPSGTRMELGRPASMHTNSDKRSSLNDRLPKYYDGYDVDELFEKQRTGHLSKKEIEIIDEIVRGYYAERLKNKKDGKCAYGPLTINGAQIFPRGTVIEYPTVTEYRKKYGNRKRNDGQGDEE